MIKQCLNPKQFINKLPEKFSWYLLLILVIVRGISWIPYLFVLDLNIIKKVLLVRAKLPIDSIVSSPVLIQSLAMLLFFAVIVYTLKIGIFSLIFKGILKIFKRDISFFKLINIYMCAKIAAVIVSVFSVLFSLSDNSFRASLPKILMDQGNLSQLIFPLYNNYIFTFLAVLSAIAFYTILIYGILISIRNKKNKIAPN